MNAVNPQAGAMRRRDNFFRDSVKNNTTIMAQDHARNLPAGQEIHHPASPAGEAMTDQEKGVVIERHITAFASTLPAGSLSEASKRDIFSRAMLGKGSSAAIMASVMQAVAVVKPNLQLQAVNYYSSAAGVDAATAEGALGIDGRSSVKRFLGGLTASGGRGGYFGRGDYSGVGSSSSYSGGSSSSGYLSNPGSVSMVNYSSTPYAATGMTYSTFNYLHNDLRQERFSGTNIQHSGQDARKNGFSPNDKPVAKAFAVLDRDDGARHEARNTQLGTFRDKMAKDPEIERLKALRDNATGEERQKLDEQLIARGLQLSQETGTRKFLDAAPTAAAREQGRVIERKTIEKMTGANIALQAKLGDEATLGKSTTDNTRIAHAAIGQPNAPADTPILQAKADALRSAATPNSDAAIMGELAALDTKPSTLPSKAASAIEAKSPAAPDAGQSKATTAAVPETAPPVQTAEAKAPSKPKSPGASMSA
jgi:hypothetical protein